MVSHVSTRPHQFGKDYAGLLVVEEARLLWCKVCLKQCGARDDFIKHIADSHLMDDILLEAGRADGK